MRELLTPKPATAMEIAALAKALPIREAADLIEQYARTAAAGARLEGATEIRDVVFKHLERA